MAMSRFSSAITALLPFCITATCGAGLAGAVHLVERVSEPQGQMISEPAAPRGSDITIAFETVYADLRAQLSQDDVASTEGFAGAFIQSAAAPVQDQMAAPESSGKAQPQ